MEIPEDYPISNPDSAIGWFYVRMKMSGLTQAIRHKCGLSLTKEADGFIIPYHTIDGESTPYYRTRIRDPGQHTQEPGQSSGQWRGKYTQPKGSKNFIYWPPLFSQRIPFNNVGCPLLVCEGELKSIACQSKLVAESTVALVCGAPGTTLSQGCMDELRAIPCTTTVNVGGQGEHLVRRTVYLAMDWNGTGPSKANSDTLERNLRSLFTALGAKVVALRWPIPEKAKEQKLDDWIVAGGDLGAAMAESLARDKGVDEQLQLWWDHLNENYFILHGKYIPRRNKLERYPDRALNITESDIKYIPFGSKAKKPMLACDVWGLQPAKDRNYIDGVTFVPPRLGDPVEEIIYKDGKRLMNVVNTGWISAPFVPDGLPSIEPFLKLINRLCQEHDHWFLNYLAQTAQYPKEPGQHVVIFRDEGSTGKSAVFKTLERVWGSLIGPAKFHGNFNSLLEGKLFAYDSDTVAKGFDRDLESVLKNMSGEGTMIINRKQLPEYTVENYVRIIMATNKDWITPIHPNERRYAIFGGAEKWPVQEWLDYKKWMNEGGIDAIRYWLLERDLTGFEISLQAPRTLQRIAMEQASAPTLKKILISEEGPFAYKRVWSTADIVLRYNQQEGVYKQNVPGLAQELPKYGFEKRQIKRDGDRQGVRLWALRPMEGDNDAWWAEYKKEDKKHGG